jgi:tRNA threonylcarbamoyladenosine biosynthesis protein TsaB
MLILTIRTDKPEAEVGLYDGERQLACSAWQAHRRLAETIHLKIDEILKSQHKGLPDLEGIAVYRGPGSFTGLRIGISVANALADGLAIPVVGGSGEAWKGQAANRLGNGATEKITLPEYGAEPHITQQKK